jgi:hypothetical protein
MFQDAAATVPVTADGQPVGLALDKRLWGGKTLAQVKASQPQLVVNGGFDTDTAWTKGTGWSIANGKASASGAAVGTTMAPVTPVVATIGSTYLVAFDVVDLTSGAFSVGIGGQVGTARSALGHYEEYITATTTGSIAVYTRIGATTTGSIDNVSVKLIPGNHSPQTNVAARRTYKTNGTLAWLWDDNSDDAMPVTFGNLGSNCTVAYATASGVTILTAQTISGVYNVPGKGANLYGCIIIDRALTPSETASVTAWLKKKAGL